MVTLGVNIDHIATLRQARGGSEPDPIQAAVLAELAGAHGITAHLREDRRHIQDRDLRLLKEVVTTHLNLEMAATAEMIGIACATTPFMTTLVPEKREERTTEGGLDVAAQEAGLTAAVTKLRNEGILVSLFIVPDVDQIAASHRVGATHIELHTGAFANVRTESAAAEELERLRKGALSAHELGLRVNAGHGLNYRNAAAVAALPHLEELNIGHSIVSRASLVGLERAVREMIALLA